MAVHGRGNGGDQRRMVNPKVLLLIGAVVLVVSSAIAIFYAASYSPNSGSSKVSSAPVATTSVVPAPRP